jgi:hypothetical protein
MADGTDCAAGWATPTRGNRSSSTATARSPNTAPDQMQPTGDWVAMTLRGHEGGDRPAR